MLVIDNVLIERQQKRILQTPTLTVGSKEHVCILGPNGAGKSSLLKGVCGEWPLSEGRIQFYQTPLSQWPRRKLAKHLGVLPQASQIDFPFTAYEVVSIGATPLRLNRRQQREAALSVMRKTDVAHLSQAMFTQLSGGERQRVHLARVLLQLSQAEQPPLLLMDEPTSAQDLGHQHELMQLTDSLRSDQHFAVLSVLHDLNLAARYADKVWIIDQKRIVKEGTPEEVLSPESVETHWHYRPEKIDGLAQGFGLL